jgi:diguanylate cyclase (GGDEF)-like protein
MSSVRSPKLAARRLGLLYLATGLVTLLAAVAPGPQRAAGAPPLPPILIGLADVAVAGFAAVLPWERWPARATLVAAAAATFGLVTLAVPLTQLPGILHALFLVLFFVWVGVYHPPSAGPWLTAPATATFLVPRLADLSPADAAGAVFLLPTCALVSRTIAVAVERTERALALADRRAFLLAQVAGASRPLSSLDPEEVVRVALDTCARMGFDAAAVELVDPESQRVRISHAVGIPFDSGAGFPAPDGIAALVQGAGGPVVLRDAEAERLAHPVLRHGGFRSVAALPLWTGEWIAGVLVVASREPGRAGEGELEALQLLAGQAGRALQNAEFFAEEQRHGRANLEASLLDQLTGVGNRRRAEQMLAGLRPGDGVVMLDLDHFKSVNDTDGHAAGDAVLAALGRYLRSHLREGDQVARYGGEEFLVVLQGPGDKGAIARRLVDGWRDLHPRTTVSGGLAVHRAWEQPARTLERADLSLYAAKRAGRDRLFAEGGERDLSTDPSRDPVATLPGVTRPPG